jgi:hypothetical protein
MTRLKLKVTYYTLSVFFLFLSLALALIDRFAFSVTGGDLVLKRANKARLLETLTNGTIEQRISYGIWSVTARVMLVGQNMVFFTVLWVFPNWLESIAPRIAPRIEMDCRGVNSKLHRFVGLYFIGIPGYTGYSYICWISSHDY